MKGCDQNFHEKHDYLVPVTSDFSSPQNDPKDVSKEVWFVIGHSRLKAYKKEKWGRGWVISDRVCVTSKLQTQAVEVIGKNSKQKPMVF